jgi:hypothetical protein
VTVPSAPALSGDTSGSFFDDGNGSYDVTVTLTGGLTSSPGSRLAVYAPGSTPEVDSVGPSGGSQTAGTPVTVYGSGFTGATVVAFGGTPVPVTAADVNSEGTQITVTAPAESEGTTCADTVTATKTVCQVTVTVTTPAGTSPAGSVLPEYSGKYAFDRYGFLAAPSGCDCEVTPAATEFDYLPAPTITSFTNSSRSVDGTAYANERGGTIETLHGTGLGLLGLEWVDAGPSQTYTSEDYNITYVSDDELRVALPAEPLTTTVSSVPVSVQTLASPNRGDLASKTAPSTVAEVPFAPTVSVSSVTASGPVAAGPVTGGTKLTLHGSGFTATSHVNFTDEGPDPFSVTRQYTVDVMSNTELTVTTPANNPGTDDVQVCNATRCSVQNHSRDTFVFYPPGNPRLTGATPRSGPAQGGTVVTLTGANLGYTRTVYFGARAATIVPEPSLLDSGSTSTVVVKVPAGTAGTTVDIRVETLESLVTGSDLSPATTAARFTYTRS